VAKRAVKGPNFEKAMQELESIVTRMEEEQLELDESMALYEKGMELIKQCTALLEAAQERVRMLVQGEDGIEERPFAADGEDDGLSNTV
jgi:exodeoxyribonuclease VII small subunit